MGVCVLFVLGVSSLVGSSCLSLLIGSLPVINRVLLISSPTLGAGIYVVSAEE